MARKIKELYDKLTPESLAIVKAKTAAILAELPLQELRQARHLSQTTLAKTMNIPQSNVSRIERQTDTYVSTVRSFVEAMGGKLNIVASFPDGDYRINQFEDIGEVEEFQEAEIV
jgi:transcriptional regulator with XRE-family HTH domain